MKTRTLRTIIACLALLTIALTATISSTGQGSPSRGTGLANAGGRFGNKFSFRDDFNYNDIAALQAAGWTLCGGAPLSFTSVGNGVLNLTNDGTVGDAACYNNVPPRVTSWSVSARGRWIGGYYGSIEIIVNTPDHAYRWDADGFYDQYILLRDDVIVFRTNGYTPQLNAWHDLRLDGNSRTGLTMFIDGQQIATFADIKGTTYSMNSFTVMAGWESMESWDWVTAASA